MMFYRLLADKAGDGRFLSDLRQYSRSSTNWNWVRIQLGRDQGNLFFIG
jgi:hypothetical protein